MKIIQVENQVEGGKVALELLKEKLAQGAKTLGLATGSSLKDFTSRSLRATLIFQRCSVSIWMNMLVCRRTILSLIAIS